MHVIVTIIVLLICMHAYYGGFSHEQWPERKKFFRTLGYIFCGWVVYMVLLVLYIAVAEAAELRTYKNANGQTIGRSSTDARGNTTFYDNMGRQQGRSSTSNGTTTFRDNMGRETGQATRSNR
jgi:hypothetical protein